MDTADAEQMLAEILDLEDGLTEWEVNFVESVSKQSPTQWTIRQREMIRKIWEKLLF